MDILGHVTDRELLRSTLDAIDAFVADVQRGRGGSPAERTALVVDVGRAAAAWSLDLTVDGGTHRVDLVVLCDVTDGEVSDARLYLAAPRDGAAPEADGGDTS